jgi:hypothetical protein
MLELPFLETLSLGLIPDPIDDIAELPISWDPLLNYFASDPEMLPSLRRFEVDIFPTDLRFFAVHGSKIQTFRTTNWSTPPMLPSTLPLLPNLDSLILTQSTEYVTLPPFHPTLRRICIAPFMEDQIVVPPRFFTTAVLTVRTIFKAHEFVINILVIFSPSTVCCYQLIARNCRA